MSPIRLIREATMLLATVSGAVIGFVATLDREPAINMSCAFFGMAVFGAFADFCMRGGK